MLDQLSIFLLDSEKRLVKRGLSLEDRNHVLKRMVKDLEKCEFFKPITSFFDDEDDDLSDDPIAGEPSCFDKDPESPLNINDKIKEKQKEYGIKPDDPVEKDQSTLSWGRTDLHQAVLFADETVIRECVSNGSDATAKDNNGHTPYEIAILYENTAAMRLLEELNAAY